jgi:hypothetical protein
MMDFSISGALAVIIGRHAMSTEKPRNSTPDSPPPPPPQKRYNFSVEVPFKDAVVTIQLNAQPPVPGSDAWLCHADIRRHGIYDSRYHESVKFGVITYADNRCDALRNCIATLPEFLLSWRTEEEDVIFHAHAVEWIVNKLTQHMRYFEMEQRGIDVENER